jgi:hypothetical protein
VVVREAFGRSLAASKLRRKRPATPSSCNRRPLPTGGKGARGSSHGTWPPPQSILNYFVNPPLGPLGDPRGAQKPNILPFWVREVLLLLHPPFYITPSISQLGQSEPFSPYITQSPKGSGKKNSSRCRSGGGGLRGRGGGRRGGGVRRGGGCRKVQKQVGVRLLAEKKVAVHDQYREGPYVRRKLRELD